ncbi:MAG: ABC transporter substrate-binding protein [Oscillospiraceae bacterium]
MKNFKKAIVAVLALAMLLSLAACGGTQKASTATDVPASAAPSAATSTVATVETGKLHMATIAAFPPYERVKDDGTYEGIDVEIATKIAEKLGLELVVDDMDFGAVITAVQTGKSDIAMAGMTVTDERKKNIDFTDSYATGKQVIIVKEGSDIKSADDLADKMIGTQEATTGYIYCSASTEDGGYGEDHVTAYTNGAMAVQALVEGKVDCVIIDSQPAAEYVKANKGLTILETPFVTEDYAIGVSKDNTALTEAVNSALKELIADGTVKSIIDKYIKA